MSDNINFGFYNPDVEIVNDQLLFIKADRCQAILHVDSISTAICDETGLVRLILASGCLQLNFKGIDEAEDFCELLRSAFICLTAPRDDHHEDDDE